MCGKSLPAQKAAACGRVMQKHAFRRCGVARLKEPSKVAKAVGKKKAGMGRRWW